MNWVYIKIKEQKEIDKGIKRTLWKSGTSRIKDNSADILKYINKRNPNNNSCMVLQNISSKAKKVEIHYVHLFID